MTDAAGKQPLCAWAHCGDGDGALAELTKGTPMPDPLTDAGLRAKAELFIRQLEINGYKSLPCAVCRRSPIIGVDALHNLLRDLLAALGEVGARPPEAQVRAAEARLQALQPYLDHLPDCVQRLTAHSIKPQYRCSCGLATLTQPGAATKE